MTGGRAADTAGLDDKTPSREDERGGDKMPVGIRGVYRSGVNKIYKCL